MDLNQLGEFISNNLLLVAAFVVIVSLLIGGEVRRRTSGVRDVESGEATRLLNHENALMIDMRSDKDYRDGHIVNAIHIDAKDEAAPDKLEKYRDRPLIVYCRSGNTTTQVCRQLQKKGFETVYNLKGGVAAWQQANLPLIKGR